MIQMNVSGLTIDPFTNMPIIILKDLEGATALTIWIGLIEASSIATEIEKVELTRPMTHDLMRDMLMELEVNVDRVEITDLTDNTFYARVFLSKNGAVFDLDSRPSDAISLALRTKSNIFVSKKVIEKARSMDMGKEIDEGKLKEQKWTEILESLSTEDFGKYKM